ncbi:MAG: ABC transporter permease [Caldilineaceae bacterium]|nr:ABC transporter permease [Caldilineaceae bacterium]
MTKILNIMWKELYTTFRDRNLILIMFLTPIVLSTIMGMAFGGLGGDDVTDTFGDIPIVVVNLDEGFNLADQIQPGDDITGTASLNDVTFEVGGQTINLGEQLQLNANLAVTDTDLQADNAAFNMGDTLAGILLSTPVTETATTTATDTVTTTTVAGFDNFSFGDLTCPLVEDDGEDGSIGGFSGTLEDLFDAVEMDDPVAARAAVDRGEFVAAVIIPVGFTNQLMPSFDFLSSDDTETGSTQAVTRTATITATAAVTETVDGAVEIYANAGDTISAGIVRAVVNGVVNQLVRVSIAIESVLAGAVDTLLAAFNLQTISQLDLSGIDANLVTQGLQNIDASVLDPISCLLVPGAGTIQVDQQPLDILQTRSTFAFIMILLGSAQAIFFAMFTGIFGVNSIYQERDNWTLQRLVASPTPRSYILAGKLLGNVVVVTAQLSILFASFTVIASLIEGEPSFIWGTNVPALLLVILGIAAFVSGLGVLVVGLARSPEQVQFVGPMVSSTLGALGGAFGFRLPDAIAGISPVWWGSEALLRVSNGEIDQLGLPLLVLFGSGLIAFAVGTFFFRRRLDL